MSILKKDKLIWNLSKNKLAFSFIMNAILRKEQTLTLFEDSEFILSTQKQITKDFQNFNISFPEKFQTTPLEFDDLKTEIIERLTQVNPSALQQLFYIIDLPESLLPQTHQPEVYFSEISELIIRREAYKVYLRRKFS